MGKQFDSWTERAACAGTDTEAFYPEKKGDGRKAKAVCDTCEVVAECLQDAVNRDERYGIWGGLTEQQRAPLRLRRRRG